jgi:hypothetical protein
MYAYDEVEVDADAYDEAYDEANANEINSAKRDEFIYTRVFNNQQVHTQVPIDFSIGTLAEWGTTCKHFNDGDRVLQFATIYIVYNVLVCNNIHPFVEVNQLIASFNAHVIHDRKIR